jgi:hypothetical protein
MKKTTRLVMFAVILISTGSFAHRSLGSPEDDTDFNIRTIDPAEETGDAKCSREGECPGRTEYPVVLPAPAGPPTVGPVVPSFPCPRPNQPNRKCVTLKTFSDVTIGLLNQRFGTNIACNGTCEAPGTQCLLTSHGINGNWTGQYAPVWVDEWVNEDSWRFSIDSSPVVEDTGTGPPTLSVRCSCRDPNEKSVLLPRTSR